MSLLRKLALGSALSMTGLIASKLLSFLYRIVVGRGLNPETYGFLTLGIAGFFLAQNLADFSIEQAIERYISEEQNPSNHLFSALLPTIPVSILAGAGLMVLAPNIVQLFDLEGQMVPVLRIMSLGVPFGVANSSLNSVFVAKQKIKYDVYVSQIFQNTVKVITAVLAIYFSTGLVGVTFGFVVSVVFATVLSTYYLCSNFELGLPSKLHTRRMLNYSYPLFFSGILGFILGWTDSIMIAFFTSSGAKVGIYNAAFPLSTGLTVFMGGVSTVAFPLMSDLYSEGDLESVFSIYRTSVRWILFLVMPSALIMILSPEAVLSLTFGPDYTPASTVLRVLAAGTLLSSIFGPASSVLKATDKQQYTAYNSLFATGINVLSNLALIPMLGVVGAGISSVFSSAAANLLAYTELRYEHKFDHQIMENIKQILSGLLALSAGILVKNYLSTSLLYEFIFSTATLLAVYLLLIRLFGLFGEQDRETLEALGERTGTQKILSEIGSILSR